MLIQLLQYNVMRGIYKLILKGLYCTDRQAINILLQLKL